MSMMRDLVLVREFELACERLWTGGEPLVGEFHLSLGQEACAVGTCAAIEPDDLICPSIRGMGVYLCRETPMVELFASFFDRHNRISDGRWAHWHSPVEDKNILMQTGMLGAGLSTTAGVALDLKLKGSDRIAVAMFGDGTTNTGYFHEAMNFLSVKQLPIVCVIENNQYAVSTNIRTAARAEDLSSRAVGYGIPGETVDGNDVLAVYEAVKRAAARARRGEGPTLIECKTYRWAGQTLRDPDLERSPDEKEEARKNCSVTKLKSRLMEATLLDAAGWETMTTGIRQQIDEAIAAARQLPVLDAGPTPLETYEPYV